MTSRTLRRRLYHGDIDGGRHDRCETSDFDALSEPLLADGHYDYSKHNEGTSLVDSLDEQRRKEYLHWTLVFSNVIAQWAQWLANIVLSSGSLLARIVPFMSGTQNGANNLLPPVILSPLQDALRQLWRLAYPDRQVPALKSEAWKDMGWQGSDPSTDFRGGGFISLENLIFFAKTYPEAFQNLLYKRDGDRSEWEYPFAVAGINISFMLVQMLDLQSGNPSKLAGKRFLQMLSYDDMAFDDLFCVAFKMLDVQWVAKRASYMEFNEVLKSMRSQLEREMALEDVSSVKDLPAYNLLRI
ncbi:ELMO domain-containing protein C-like isoform X2 [Salvia splendens]|uniref:ELMO domain-containing protein C-like isoform X2 n=1 Tax=Salvia splendens TaxID=180675 RepID=UPI001C253094|nr:ELMO domain-containing protein C-like isoform X2 [Salvia splendens]